MREELIGYLLGALDAGEQAKVEQALQSSEQLRQELEQLAECLEPFEAETEGYDPPAGLAARTCQFLDSQVKPVPARSGVDRPVATGGWSLLDMTVAAGVCAAAVLLFLPAIAQSRHQASLVHCQNNLTSLSTAFSSYSNLNGGFLPAIPAEGKFAAAGIYAPTLLEQGYVENCDNFFCTNQAKQNESATPAPLIPTRAQLAAAEGRLLAELLKRMGGDYAYTLGYVSNGQLRPVRNEHRANFAILADSPNLNGASRTSLNHGGCGQNVLFEDGHIQYVVGCQLGCGDNLFLNDAGFAEAGNHADDSVLGHSSMPPVHRVRLITDR